MKNPFLYILFFLAINGVDFTNLGDIFRNGKVRFTLLALVPVTFLFLEERLSFAPAAFGALALCSFVMNDYRIYSEFSVFQVLACLALAAFIVGFKKESFGKILIFSGVVQAVLSFLQLRHHYLFFQPIDPFKNVPVDLLRPIGTIGNETVLGPFLVACLAPALWGKNYLCSLLIILCAILTHSSMTMAALGTMLAVYTWHRLGFKCAAAFVGLGMASILVAYRIHPGIADFDGRWFIWSLGWRAFKSAPLFGSGIGAWAGIFLPAYTQEALAQFQYHVPLQLHSDYLEFLVEYGAVPALVFVAAGVHFIYKFRPTWPHAVCASLLVNSMANFPLCLISHALIFVVAWGYSMKESCHGVARAS